MNPSAIFNGLLKPRLLVPQWVMMYSTDSGKVILHTRQKAFYILSPLIPNFRVWKDKKNLSKILLHLSNFAIIESPICTNFALVNDADMVTCFFNVLHQPKLPILTNGLIRGLIFNK